MSIIAAYTQATRLGKQTALATVVHVDGSSYRRPGARMLVDDTGQLTGAISGGCLEGDALTKAMLVLNQQQAKLVTYDTTDDDDAKFGVGLGCNGIIHVLIEPINPADPQNPLELIKIFAGKRQKVALVTLFSLENKRAEQLGTCFLWQEDKASFSKNVPDSLKQKLQTDAENVFNKQAASFKSYAQGQQSFTAFIEYIPPPISLIIIGAGNDVVPLTNMAAVLGWQTTVVDGRATHAKTNRFTPGCQVFTSKPEKVLEQINIDEQTAVVLMTHNYHYDLAVLKALLLEKVPYIGSLGPKKKLARMLDDLAAAGIVITDTVLSTIYGPAGLDIGAETPEEIALSILAEIKAVLVNRDGSHLRNKKSAIHDRSLTVIQNDKL